MIELLQRQSDLLGLRLETMGFPEGWESQEIWRADYQRDPERTRQAQLVAGLAASTAAETRRSLTAKAEKERRSWLRYLESRSAVVAVAYGGAKLYPLFQFRDGDVLPEVADLNEKLFRRLAGDMERTEVSWDVLEWWVTPIPELGGAPKDLIGAGDLLESVWDEHLPGPHPVS
ncbi:hypothetical protein ACH0BA_06200 [Kocuria palustris]